MAAWHATTLCATRARAGARGGGWSYVRRALLEVLRCTHTWLSGRAEHTESERTRAVSIVLHFAELTGHPIADRSSGLRSGRSRELEQDLASLVL